MKTSMGRWIFLILSLIFPLLYLTMGFSIRNGIEVTDYDLIFQCICLVLAILRLCFVKFRKCDYGLLTFVLDCIVIISIGLTCFGGFFFMLELFHVPWFPAQR